MSTSDGSQSQTTDEGYASGIATSEGLSRAGSLALPGHPSGTISPTIGHSASAALSPGARTRASNHTRRSKSDSGQAFRLNHSPGSKREKFQSIFRRFSQTSVKSGSSSQVPGRDLTDGSLYTRRRRHERDVNTSIDLTSPDEASAPLIIKTAQAGSWPDVGRLIEAGSDIEARHLPTRRTALLVAAHCGNESVVDVLIHKHARLDASDKSGSTALHLAASRGHCGVIELLLSEAVDIEARDARGRTPLWIAAERGEIEATDLFLSFSARVNARTDTQMTALHVAAKQGDDAIVKLLINGCVDLEAKDGTLMTALHYACEKGHVQVAEALLDHKAYVDAPGCDKRTPLIYAAAVGGIAVIKLLLKKKASPRYVDDADMTALHWAAYNGHTEVVEVLSNRKGSLTAVNIAKRTALHLAAMNSQFAVVELLLRKQVPLETRCQSGLTALHYACLANSVEISKLLLMSSADIEAQIEEELQRRPVHLAATQGSMALLNLLCDKNASLEARDSLGYRALGVACRAGHAAVVQNLLDRGSPAHLAPDNWTREDSPLCLAAMGGHLPVVMLLLERGASVVKQDEQDWLPYQHAAYNGHPRVLEALLSRTLANTAAGNFRSKIELTNIGFAPSADISNERKRNVLNLLNQAWHQPESLIQAPTISKVSYLPDNNRGQDTGMASARPAMARHVSPLTTVPEATARHGPAQELPGSLEQGLPVSRSQTPEQMQGPSNTEEPMLSRPIWEAFDDNALRHGQASFAWEPQQFSTAERTLLNHPAPVREPVIYPDGILGNDGLFGPRLNDISASVAEGSRSIKERAPNDPADGNNRVQPPALIVRSDSESVASFSTASEGDGFPRDIAELPS